MAMASEETANKQHLAEAEKKLPGSSTSIQSLSKIQLSFGFGQQNQDITISSAECVTNLETIRIGLEWFTNPDHLLLVAQEHGIFTSSDSSRELWDSCLIHNC
eukprot:scaffold13571_cov83-Skeletonema_dohrnii-CCMP3373.AAC.1